MTAAEKYFAIVNLTEFLIRGAIIFAVSYAAHRSIRKIKNLEDRIEELERRNSNTRR